jgi:hypothetical protein
MDGASGDNLAALAGYRTRYDLLEIVHALTVMDRPAPRYYGYYEREAESGAQVALTAAEGRRVILLGRIAMFAMGFPHDFFEPSVFEDSDTGVLSAVVAIPHLSGKCRLYNRADVRMEAAEVVRGMLGLPRPRACVWRRCGRPSLGGGIVCADHAEGR